MGYVVGFCLLLCLVSISRMSCSDIPLSSIHHAFTEMELMQVFIVRWDLNEMPELGAVRHYY